MTETSDLLDGFYQERQVSTCPASHIGRLKGLFEETGSDGSSHTASCPESPNSGSTASTAVPPPGAILSLADGGVTGVKAVPPPPGGPAPSLPELPSTGSSGHAAGRCKPCAFFHTVGCENGPTCVFCHLCDADERKRRRKDKLEAKKLAYRLRRSRREGEEQAC